MLSVHLSHGVAQSRSFHTSRLGSLLSSCPHNHEYLQCPKHQARWGRMNFPRFPAAEVVAGMRCSRVTTVPLRAPRGGSPEACQAPSAL